MPTSQRTHDTAASFVLKTARVAYSLTDARAAHSGPVETFRLRAPETGLHGPKDEARFRKIVRESGTHPECCFIPGTPSRAKHASTSVAQVPSQASPLPGRVHATVGRLLDRTRKRQHVAIWIRHVEIPLAPGRISRTLGLKSFAPQVLPKRIHIRHVENHPPPAWNRATLL